MRPRERHLVAGLIAWAVAVGAAGCATPAPPVSRLELRLQHRVHRVAPKESAWAIAQKYGVSLEALVELNELEDPSRLFPGDELLIPGPPPRDLTPVSTPTPAPPAPKPPDLSTNEPPATRTCRQVAPWLDPPADVSKAGFSWPVDGVVITKYGKQDGLPHEGVDIAAPVGTAVRAAADGEVVFAGTQGGFGRLVVIKHGDARASVYGHQLATCVKAGQKVSRGEVVGLVGQSGGIPSPYLYFEIREGAATVNPRAVLPP